MVGSHTPAFPGAGSLSLGRCPWCSAVQVRCRDGGWPAPPGARQRPREPPTLGMGWAQGAGAGLWGPEPSYCGQQESADWRGWYSPPPPPHPPGNPCSNPPPSCHSLLAPPSLCRDKVLPHLYPSATPSLVASPAPKRQSSLLPCCPQSLPPASKVTALSSPPYTPILTNTSSPGLSRPGPSSHRAQELLASPRSL